MAAKKKLVRLNYAIVGVGERGAVFDVERTDYLQGIIDAGWAEEIDADDTLDEPMTETAAETQAAAAAAVTYPAGQAAPKGSPAAKAAGK